MVNSNLERLLGLAFPDKAMGRVARNLYMNNSFETLLAIIDTEITGCYLQTAEATSDTQKDILINRLENLELLKVEVSCIIEGEEQE